MAGDMYLENLEEFVFDENRIVTYKWLSQTLQVHVNQAKQMLYTFFNQQKDKEAGSVNVTYLVSGVEAIDNGEKVRKVSIVNSQNLEKHKASLQCVSGVHIYSIQKAQLKDSNSLYTADYDLTLEQIKQTACSRFSAIECSEAKARSETELAELEEKARLPDDSQSQSKAKVNGKPGASSSNGSASVPSVQKTEAAKPATKPNDQRKKGQRSAMDMFTSMKVKKEKDVGKETEKKSEAEKTTKTEKTCSLPGATENKAKAENKSKKGMLAFMSTAPKKTTEKEKQENEESPQNVNVVEKEEKMSMKEESNKSKSTNKRTDNNETKIQKKTKRIVVSDSDEEESNPKKKQRRRIMMADSSSDEDEEEDSDDEPIPPTPPQKPVDNDSEDEMDCGEPNGGSGEVETGTHIKRIKVWKTRQVEDEDGFMVTEKYYEYEDTEVVDEEKPPLKEVQPLKKSVPDDTENEGKKGKGKKGKGDKSSHGTTQKSLMSFFKKT